MIKKANKILFMLRSLKRFGFDQDELSIVYKSYVRPVEYADVVLHSGLTCKHDIEHIQRRACRTILGHQFITYFESITTCNLIKLSDRRVDHYLSFVMGLEDNPRIKHLIPPTRIAVHGYNLWKANDLTQPMTKTKRYKQSPVPYFKTLLNNGFSLISFVILSTGVGRWLRDGFSYCAMFCYFGSPHFLIFFNS